VLRYNAPPESASANPPSGSKQAPQTKESPQTAAAQPAAPAPPPNDLVHVIGRFFKRLFGGH
jgi:hypothetical protein